MQDVRRRQQGPDQLLHLYQGGGVAQHLAHPSGRGSGTGEIGDQLDHAGDRDVLAVPAVTCPQPQRRRCNRCSVTVAISVTWRRTTPTVTAVSSPVPHPPQHAGTWSTISSASSTSFSEKPCVPGCFPAYARSCAATNVESRPAPDRRKTVASTLSASSGPGSASARRSPPPAPQSALPSRQPSRSVRQPGSPAPPGARPTAQVTHLQKPAPQNHLRP